MSRILWQGIKDISTAQIKKWVPVNTDDVRANKCPAWISSCYLPIVSCCCSALEVYADGDKVSQAAISELGFALTERLVFLGKDIVIPMIFEREERKAIRFSENSQEDIWLYMQWEGIEEIRKNYAEFFWILEESVICFLWSNIIFLDALKKDWNFLQQEYGFFSCATRINQDMKELHKTDKNVHIVTFDNGRKVVFKQKRSRETNFWNECCEFMKQEGLLEIYVPKSMECGESVWQEYISEIIPDDEKTKKEFFYRTGQLLCLCYLLHATDLHKYNIVQKGTWPVIIDSETVCNGVRNKDKEFTVEDCFLLPACRKTPYTEQDIAALAGKGGRQMGNSVQAGFRDTYRQLENCKEINYFFAEERMDWFRYILHPTWLYVSILEREIYNFRRDKRTESLKFESYHNLLPQEKKLMSDGYLPVFQQRYNSRALFDENGKVVIEDFFNESLREDVLKRFQNMSERDMDKQITLIDICFQKEG